jgi:hypothetical protein
MEKHLFYLLLFVILTSFSASAQKKSFRNILFSQHDFVDTVKIKVWEGAVIIPVEIKGEVKNLMFDAGTNDTLGEVKAVVRKGSEAYQKGIRTGDYLISFNGIPITDYCTFLNLDTEVEVKRYVYRSPKGEIKEVEW